LRFVSFRSEGSAESNETVRNSESNSFLKKDGAAQSDDSGTIDVFDRSVDDLEIRGQFDPGCGGEVVENFHATFVVAEDDVGAVVGEVDVVITDTEAILLASRDDPLAAKTNAIEVFDEVGFSIGDTEAPEEAPAPGGIVGFRDDILVEIVSEGPITGNGRRRASSMGKDLGGNAGYAGEVGRLLREADFSSCRWVPGSRMNPGNSFDLIDRPGVGRGWHCSRRVRC
jgi:hypothetical protein